MSSNHKNAVSNTETPTKHESFTFGEYVSPQPKPISLDIKLRPDPVVKYETNQVIKTECKPIQQPDIDNNNNINKQHQAQHDFNKNDERKHIQKVQATPLKTKVVKQQNEIDSLKAQLLKLQIENERLKSKSTSNSNSVTPTNEIAKDPNNKHIVFNPSVAIMDERGDKTKQDTTLNDKASVMRSNRNATPYKPKYIKASQTEKEKAKQNEKNTESEDLGHHHSRGQYRITPIPQKRHQTKLPFKSKLQTIADKENIANDTDKTPKDIQKLKIIQTPLESVTKGDESANCSANVSFNLGQPAFKSASSSFLYAPSQDSSILPESTPDFMVHPSSTGNGASNLVSPILTPMRGQKTDSKPFLFSWNKKK